MHNRRLLVVTVVAGLVAASTAGYLMYRGSAAHPISIEPARTDFGTALPSAFAASAIVAPATPLTESYTLSYGTSTTQSSIAFATSTLPAALLASYKASIARDGWAIVNEYHSDAVSALYGRKGSDDMNITVVPAGAGSRVSISTLTPLP
jgi:hypothetical protein